MDANVADAKAMLMDHFNRRKLGLRFFEVHFLCAPRSWPGKLPSVVVLTPTLKSALYGQMLAYIAMSVELASVVIRREIAIAEEAARNLCLAAIDRAVAVLRLDDLLRLVAALAVEVLNLIRPESPPRVVAAGGQTTTFAPLT